MTDQSNNPKPLFIIHNTKQITCVLFSKTNNNCLYVGTRDGEFYIYDLETRRPIFKSNFNNQSLTNILEINENTIFAYCRNGAVFRISKLLNVECKLDINLKKKNIFRKYF